MTSYYVKKLTKYVISILWLARTNDDLRILWSCWLLAQLACDDQKKLSHNLLEWVINVILIYNLQIMWSVPAKNSLCWTSLQKKMLTELPARPEIVWVELPTRNSLSWATRQKKFELNYQTEIVWPETTHQK